MRMARILTAAALAGTILPSPAFAAEITGAGATFPYPIYAKWADAYRKETGTSLNYQSIGSGGGIKQVKAGTVDFGASDAPLNNQRMKEMPRAIVHFPTVAGAVVLAYNLPGVTATLQLTPADLAKNGLVQFPTVIGGDVPVVNLKGIAPGRLKLSGEVLADIFLGKVKKWNDPAITATNPGVELPGTAISVVHRSDGSGTTFIWTNYLSKVSPEWKSKVGEGTSVNWPTGVGGKGNEGVASYVQRIQGAIGYVEYAYVLQSKMAYTQVKNRAGQFVAPSARAFQAAAAGADWGAAPGMYLILTDAQAGDAWPIAGATFILMHEVQDKPENAKQVLRFFDWAYAKGDRMAEALDYVPLPDPVVKRIEAHWKQHIRDGAGKPVL